MRGRRAVLAGMAAAGLVLGAQGPRGGSAAERRSLRVGYVPIIPMTQLFVMEGEGWAREAGLDLTLTRFSSGPAMVEALIAGGLDVGYLGIGPVLVARSRGADIRVVAANIIDQVALVGRGPLAAAMAGGGGPRDGFRRFREQQRRPAVIATLPRGSVPDTVLRYWLQEVAQVPAEDVEIVGAGEDQVERLLLEGGADGASITEPILTVVQERDPAARIVAPASLMLPRQPGAVVVATALAIARNREAIATLVGLHVRATRFARAEPHRAARDLVQFLGRGNVDATLMRKALSSDGTQLISNPRVIVDSTRLMQGFQQRIGVQASVVDIDALFDFSFFDGVGRP